MAHRVASPLALGLGLIASLVLATAGCSGPCCVAPDLSSRADRASPTVIVLMACCRELPLVHSQDGQPATSRLTPTGRYPGVLSADDYYFVGGKRVDVYDYEAREGEDLRFTLTSEAFDPMLVLVGPTGEQVQNDDAEASRTDARIDIDRADAGSWHLFVSSFQTGAFGTYVLDVGPIPSERGQSFAPRPFAPPLAVPARPSVGGALATGDEVLDGRGFYDTYTVEVEPGGTLRAEMASVAFAPDIVVIGPSGEVVRDDAFEGGPVQSAVRIQAAAGGTWRVVAMSRYGPREGPYTLTIRTD